MLYTEESSDRAINRGTVAAVAKTRGVSRAQVSLAWLLRHHLRRRCAPIVGASKASQPRRPPVALRLPTSSSPDEEVLALELPYTPRRGDCPGASPTPRWLAAVSARIGHQEPAGA